MSSVPARHQQTVKTCSPVMTHCVPVFYLNDTVILRSTGNVRGIGDTEIATHLIPEQQAKGKRYLFWLAQSPDQNMVRKYEN